MKAKYFEFSSYKFEPKKKKISFGYKIKFADKRPLIFNEKVILPRVPNLKNIPKGLLDNLLSGVHLMLGISYYKLYCPSKIILKKPLSEEESLFWNAVYKKGLGEFLYRNKLNSDKIAKFPRKKGIKKNSYDLKTNKRSLVGIGGGKDSIVVAELLREARHNITGFVVETNKSSNVIDNILKKGRLPSLKIRRLLDKKLFADLPGSYNGHIPVSGIYAFLGLLLAVLYDYSYVIVGNGYTSNFGNIKYKGEDINHQWSKSGEFEELFQNYTKKFITPSIIYFSLLRPFYEIRIAKMFAEYKKYFPFFSSCNSGFKINASKNTPLWCRQCPKCAFVFLLLSAFVSRKELLKIFKKNLYEDKSLLPTFRDLLGFGKLKPFDCVGEFKESQAAFYLARNKFKDSAVMKMFLPKIRNAENLIKEVFSAKPAKTVPTKFRFAGMKSCLILGYGIEGKATHRYLKKKFPKIKIGIADRSLDKNYLKMQENYDIAVKTPGIPKKHLKIQYTTASNIFFSEVKGRNKIIGITGTKGKSTTSSLIYEILKKGGKKVRLLGNIGEPMLGALLKPIKKDEIFVLELSSYQLDDIEFSPDIAVVLNLFPDHIPYHGSVDEYYNAKRNIVRFQKKGDIFVFNPKVPELKTWAKKSISKSVPFLDKLILKNSEVGLLGPHNRENIKAALTVAGLFGIPDIKIKQALREFKNLPHRLDFVGEFKGIKFYDDAASTTPESTIMAIKSIPKIGTIFLGGEDRGYDFSGLEKEIRRRKIKNIVLFPESGRRVIKSKKGLNILETSKMEQAVRFAYKNTKKGEACLLSTASPSFSLWKDYIEKGEQFKFFAKKYAKA